MKRVPPLTGFPETDGPTVGAVGRPDGTVTVGAESQKMRVSVQKTVDKVTFSPAMYFDQVITNTDNSFTQI